MAKAIFQVFFNIITGLTNIVLTPINLLVENFVPDLGNLLQRFNEALILSGGSALNYITSLIPPITKQTILVYLTFLVSFYTISISVHAIIKVYQIIKKIKIW